MKKKVYISSIITLILIFTNIFSCFALDISDLSGPASVISGLNAGFNLADSNEEKNNKISTWLNKNSELAGFIYDASSSGVMLTPSVVWSLLPQSVKNEINDSTDAEEVYNKTIQFIQNNQTVSGNNVINDDDINTFIKNNISNIENNSNSYCYSFRFSTSADAFRNTAQYLASQEMVNLSSDANQNLWYYTQGSSGDYLAKISLRDYPYLCFINRYPNNSNLEGYLVNPYDGYAGSYLTTFTSSYKWNTSNNEWESYNTTFGTNVNRYMGKYYNMIPGSNAKKTLFINYDSKQYRMFSTIPSPSDILYQPYYYNEEVWNDYSSSSGDYTFTPTNINTVSYGDTVSYINSFNSEKGYPPTIPEINNYINVQNEENTNDNGGGSGDNGGGSGGSGSGITDILSGLGSAIGNLIAGLASFLTRIIEGLASALTTLLEDIASLIESIIDGVPTVFFEFLGALFDWMPEEWVTLLSSGLVIMILIGIIKVIKG